MLSLVRAVEAGDDTGPVSIGYDAYLGIGLYDDASAATVAGVVEGSAAADAGPQAGDIITTLGWPMAFRPQEGHHRMRVLIAPSAAGAG